jgi:hypothetical protein
MSKCEAIESFVGSSTSVGLLRFFNLGEKNDSNSVSQAYDQHLNMILGNVEETITVVEYDEDTFEEHVKVRMCRVD